MSNMNNSNKQKKEESPLGSLIDVNQSLNMLRYDDGHNFIVHHSVEDIFLIVDFMHEVIFTKKKAFTIKDVQGVKKAVIKSTLARFYKMIPKMACLYEGDLHCSPDIRLFWDVVRNHDIRRCECGENPSWIFKDHVIEAEVFNDLVEKLRQRVERIGLKKRIADWQKNAIENQKRIEKYVTGLFEKYSRLVVIRLDLLYRKGAFSVEEAKAEEGKFRRQLDLDRKYFENGGDVSIPRGFSSRVNIEEVLKDRAHFFANMRSKKSLFQHLVGHIVRIEFSRFGGYHLHVALFFDGSQVLSDQWLADQIGVYWSNEITSGRGYYYNCNRAKYPVRAVGMIEHWDFAKRAELMKRLSYLAKKDQFVFVKPSLRCKLFTTGHLPKVRSVKRGRPRKKVGQTQKRVSKIVPQADTKRFFPIAGAFPRPLSM